MAMPTKRGLFFVIPCVDQARTVDLRIRTFEIPPQDCTTKDAVAVAVEGVVYYHVFNAVLCVTAIEDADHSTRHISSSILRNLVGNMEAREVLFQRDQLKQNIVIQLDEVTVLWGVKLDRVEIKDIRVARNVRRSLSHAARDRLDDSAPDDNDTDRRSNKDQDTCQRADTNDCCDLQTMKINGELRASPVDTPTVPNQQRCANATNKRPNANANANAYANANANTNVQRTPANSVHKQPNSLSNHDTSTCASTQVTPPNNQQSNHVTLNTLRYLNWLNNQNCSNDNQQSTLMWPPLEMCFVPVTINTDNQLQSNSNLVMPNARPYEEASHSPPYANAKEITTQPLVHSVFTSERDSPNLIHNSHRDQRDSRSLSPTPPPPPPPIMMQSAYSEQEHILDDQADVRPLPYSPIQEDSEGLLDDSGHFNGLQTSRKAHGRFVHQHKHPERPHSSLSISSSSTLSDTAAMASHGECRSTVDRNNTKSVPLTGPNGTDRRLATSNKSTVTISSTATARSSTSRSQPQLADNAQPASHSHAQAIDEAHGQPKSLSSTNSKFTGRHSKPLSPPPIPPPKPKQLTNSNANTNANANANANDLLLCKATDLASGTLTGRRPVPVPGLPHSSAQHNAQLMQPGSLQNNCLLNNRSQPSQMNSNQVPLSANIGFVPVSLLTNPRSLPISNNLPYAMPQMHAADTNNNGNDAAIKTKFVADSRTSNSGYSTISHTQSGPTSTATGSLQPAMRRIIESTSSASNASKKNNSNACASQSIAQKGNFADSKSVLAPGANTRKHGQFVSFAKASGNAAAAAKASNTMSNV